MSEIDHLGTLLDSLPDGRAEVYLTGGVEPPCVEINQCPIIDAYSVLYADLVAEAINALPALVAIARAAQEVRALSASSTIEMDDLHAAIDRLDVALARLEREETQ